MSNEPKLSERLRSFALGLGNKIRSQKRDELMAIIMQAEALEAREPVAECEAMCRDHGGIEGCSCSECSTPLGPRELCAYCNGCGRRVKWPMADGTEYRTPIAPLDRSRMVEALPSWIEGAKQLARQLRLDDGDTPWIGDMIRALDASKK